jgi:hypothetical protein
MRLSGYGNLAFHGLMNEPRVRDSSQLDIGLSGILESPWRELRNAITFAAATAYSEPSLLAMPL